jgi:hypothetical protein
MYWILAVTPRQKSHDGTVPLSRWTIIHVRHRILSELSQQQNATAKAAKARLSQTVSLFCTSYIPRLDRGFIIYSSIHFNILYLWFSFLHLVCSLETQKHMKIST